LAQGQVPEEHVEAFPKEMILDGTEERFFRECVLCYGFEEKTQ
jgi:hypothetical protein